jgi:hypothetical protein
MKHSPATKHNGTNCNKSGKLVGKYANQFKIGHNAVEFVIDFGQYFPENEEAELCVRIITSPFYAKNFLETLQQSIHQYEDSFGPILS